MSPDPPTSEARSWSSAAAWVFFFGPNSYHLGGVLTACICMVVGGPIVVWTGEIGLKVVGLAAFAIGVGGLYYWWGRFRSAVEKRRQAS